MSEPTEFHTTPQQAVERIRAIARQWDGEADRWRQIKREAEVKEIWFMNRASTLREAAEKVERTVEEYRKRGEADAL